MSAPGGLTEREHAHPAPPATTERPRRATRAVGAVDRATRSRRLHRRVALAAVVVALLVVPTALRLQLATAHTQRDRAEQAARTARRSERAARQELADGAATLATHQQRADRAAAAVDEARVRLAQAGVSELALRQVLNDTKAQLSGVEAESGSLGKQLDRQAAQLPEVKACIDEVVRVVGRAAQAAATGGSSAELSAECLALGQAVVDGGRR